MIHSNRSSDYSSHFPPLSDSSLSLPNQSNFSSSSDSSDNSFHCNSVSHPLVILPPPQSIPHGHFFLNLPSPFSDSFPPIVSNSSPSIPSSTSNLLSLDPCLSLPSPTSNSMFATYPDSFSRPLLSSNYHWAIDRYFDGNSHLNPLDPSLTTSTIDSFPSSRSFFPSNDIRSPSPYVSRDSFLHSLSIPSSFNSISHSPIINISRRSGSAKPPKVFVSYLPPIYTVDDVTRLFNPYGVIVSIKLLPTPNDSLLPLKYRCGFVQFDRESSVSMCIQALHQFHLTLDGKRYILTVRNASDQAPVNNTNLMVKGLSSDISERRLFDTFSQFGRVTSVRIIRDRLRSDFNPSPPFPNHYQGSDYSPNEQSFNSRRLSNTSSNCKGLAFVNYAIPADALQAIHNLHNAFLDGRRVHVSFAEKEYPYNVHVFDVDPGPEIAALQSGTPLPSQRAAMVPHLVSPNLSGPNMSEVEAAAQYPTPSAENLGRDRSGNPIQQIPSHPSPGLNTFLPQNDQEWTPHHNGDDVWNGGDQHMFSSYNPYNNFNPTHQHRTGPSPTTMDLTPSPSPAVDTSHQKLVIIIANVPGYVDETELTKELSRFGKVTQLQMFRYNMDLNTPQSAVVAFHHPMAAMRVVHTSIVMNGTPLIVSYAHESYANSVKTLADSCGYPRVTPPMHSLPSTSGVSVSGSYPSPNGLSPSNNSVPKSFCSTPTTSSSSPLPSSNLRLVINAPEFHPIHSLNGTPSFKKPNLSSSSSILSTSGTLPTTPLMLTMESPSSLRKLHYSSGVGAICRPRSYSSTSSNSLSWGSPPSATMISGAYVGSAAEAAMADLGGSELSPTSDDGSFAKTGFPVSGYPNESSLTQVMSRLSLTSPSDVDNNMHLPNLLDDPVSIAPLRLVQDVLNLTDDS